MFCEFKDARNIIEFKTGTSEFHEALTTLKSVHSVIIIVHRKHIQKVKRSKESQLKHIYCMTEKRLIISGSVRHNYLNSKDSKMTASSISFHF